MKVPFFDLTAQYQGLSGEILAALDRVCRSASFILGEEVVKFEAEFAAFCEVQHCVALNSGTSALHLALLCAGVKAGDEVITTTNTFIATAEAISYIGATPVFVDIDPTTCNLDAKRIEAAITPRTKAIVPVHLYGRPVDLEAIIETARRHNLAVIEDSCQAHGARFRDKPVGGFGCAAAFSFYPGKNLGAYGEGGALTTNDGQMAELARALRDHGQSRRYCHDRIGYNYRMDGFQAAVLRVKMKRLAQWTATRREIAERYRRLLANAPVGVPADHPRDQCAYHLFAVMVDHREPVRSHLEARGVQTAIHYPKPVHLQAAYAALGHGPGSFPLAERACERVLSMPLFPEITVEQVDYAAAMLIEGVEAAQV